MNTNNTLNSPSVSAARECDGMASMIDVLAGRATEDDQSSGQYGDWCHDSEVLRMAARILRRYSESPTEPRPVSPEQDQKSPSLEALDREHKLRDEQRFTDGFAY